MQFRINYKMLSPAIKHNYQPFRDRLIGTVTLPSTLVDYSIPQLVSLLHVVVSLKQGPSSVSNIILELGAKLTKQPFCTSFHLILLNHHLKFILAKRMAKEHEVTQVLGLVVEVLSDQLEEVLPYIDIFTVIQIYNILTR